MEFLQPWMLWGITAAIIPVAIHFWYQKKGEILEWAASRWLIDETTLKHRGIRLHEIPLMLLRCLLIILLAIILSQPVVNWWKNEAAGKTIHIVEPHAAVSNYYRFELENAMKAGDKVLWMNDKGDEVRGISDIPKVMDPELYLQNVINKASAAGADFKIYLAANQKWLDLPRVYLPGPFSLYPVTGSRAGQILPYLLTGNGEKLAVHPATGLLTKMKAVPAGYRFAGAPAHFGVFDILLKFKNSLEKETVKAAFQALKDVYEVDFRIEENEVPGKAYAWILSDQAPANTDARTLYVICGQPEPVQHDANVIYLSDPLILSASELVQNGKLPEFLGAIWLRYVGLNSTNARLSSGQLQQLFIETEPLKDPATSVLRNWLLLVFVLLTMLERWIALRETTLPKYG